NDSQFQDKTLGIIGLGYIGTHLFETLKAEATQYNITLKTFNRSNIEEIKEQEFDYFFNCTGNTGDFRSQILKTIESNVCLSHDLLKYLKVSQAYIALSSTRVYGFTDNESTIFTETDESRSNHLSIDYIYDGSKQLMESMLMNSVTDYRKIVIRLSNVIGNFKSSDLDQSTLYKLMLEKSLKQEALKIRQHPSSAKDYVHIIDAVQGILRGAIFSEKSDVFNIAYGKSYSLSEISDTLQLNSNFDTKKDRNFSNISIDKSGQLLGYKPKMEINNLATSHNIIDI
ncbi:MAG: NAD-dependent epimerase/dehydratase family protein, partial [Crocinitomicaceae bacterium]|nr:NAD-dependent epimerase/dehydratase family protein [Crocinitomicaceae bacterium]